VGSAYPLWSGESTEGSLEKCSPVWIDDTLSVHLRTDGHLGCQPVLAAVNKAAVSNCVQVFVCLYFFVL
jgi:hypothetical protein